MLYPTVSERWNAKRQSKAVLEYDEVLNDMDEETVAALWEEAEEYNHQLCKGENSKEQYDEMLHVDENGIMGYISIPKIQVRLPIYHGTSEAVLQDGAGHLEGSSLPIGGPDSHAVLSSHRGLPGARLFTDLDQLVLGDSFQITVLGQDLIYKVDQITVVEPHEVEKLQIVKDQDYCTLVTCTPYGINTHRMLVRGLRVPEIQESQSMLIQSEAVLLDLRIYWVVLIIITGMMSGIRTWKALRRKRNETVEKDRPVY